MISRTVMRGRLAAAAMLGAMAFAAPHALANETVALKNALYGAGYEVTNVSPQMDDATRSALTAFQRDQGLNASGVLDDATKSALGMVSLRVAASGSTGSAGSSQGTSSPGSVSEPDDSTTQAGEDDIEEDDDGGWFF